MLEASDRLGGKLRTDADAAGVPLEWGPDAIIAEKPRAMALVRELGLSDEVERPGTGRAFILLDGRLRPIPSGTVMGVPTGAGPLAAAVRAGIVDAAGAARAGTEPFRPGSASGDRSVADVCRERLGEALSRRLVEPLVEGVYGASAERLSMRACLPAFEGARSIVRAARAAWRSRDGSPFIALRGGMARLAEALARGLDVRVGTRALGVAGDGRSYRILVPGGELEAHALLLAAPAPVAAGLLASVAPAPVAELEEIEHTASAVVHLAYPSQAFGRPLDGAGYVVAAADRRVVAACSWLHAKWPHLGLDAPRIRAVVTGLAADLDDTALAEIVPTELSQTLHARREPTEVRVHRWPEAMPVYAPGHLDRVRRIRDGLPSRIAVAGASYDGIGVPDCVASGEAAARGLVGSLS